MRGKSVGSMVAVLAAVLVSAASAGATTITSATELTASDPSVNSRFGTSVAVSADDATALIGSQRRAGLPGAAYVFTNAAGAWSQTAELVASDGVTGDQFGTAVALSADGDTAVVGAPGAVVGGLAAAGAVYVFTRSGSTWTQVDEIPSPSPSASGAFGGRLSVSDDGSTFVVGAASNGTSFQGAAFFFVRGASGTWDAAGSIAGLSNSAELGYSVAMSGDGTVAAVGEPLYNFRSGTRTVYQPSVLTFTQSGGFWTYSRTLATPNGTVMDGFGQGGLSLDSTGSHLLVGAPNVTTVLSRAVAGAAYLYSFASGSWGSPLTFTIAASAGRRLGASAALASDGSAILLGEPSGSPTSGAGGGAAFEWTRSGTTWSTTPQAYAATDTGSTDGFAASLALPSDPTHPLIGAGSHTVGAVSQAGAAYAY